MRILRLKKAANIWHLAYLAHVATAYLRLLAQKLVSQMCQLLVLQVTVPSVSR